MRQEEAVTRGELVGRKVDSETVHGVPGLVRAVSRLNPTAVAAQAGARTMTYRQLEVRSDAVAQALRDCATPGLPVVVVVPRSTELLVALLGVLKAGLPYLPVEAQDPPARVNQVLEVAGSTTALVTAATESMMAAQGLHTIEISSLAAGAVEGEPEPLLEAAAEQPAYVLFTSGSTGAPKGVVVPNAALVNRLLWMRDAYRISLTDRILQKTPVTFDVSGWELWLPLISGATCVLLSPEEHRDPVLVARAVVEQQITVCHFVPSMLREFLRWPDAARCTSLRHVFCSGEQLPVEVARDFVSTLTAALHNLYGPTEAAIDVSHWSCPAAAADIDVVCIGRPIDNCVLTVLDENGLPVPPGHEGELHIGGVPLALGYLNRPDLTAKAFVGAPEGSSVKRLYRTGDRVRLVDGELEYLGRVDDQVKIRGQRIEPQEIEHHLAAHTELNGAAVVAGKVAEDVELVAWVQPASADAESSPLFGRLRSYLADRLPAAYVPTRFLIMDETPLTTSGKLDRALLRRRAEERLTDGRPTPAPSREVSAERPLLRELLRERKHVTRQDPTPAPLRAAVKQAADSSGAEPVAAVPEGPHRPGNPGRAGAESVGTSKTAMDVPLPDGRTVRCPQATDAHMLWREIFESGVYAEAAKGIARGETVLDVGANIGISAMYFAEQADDVRVLAFEPATDVFGCLVENLARHSSAAQAFPYAVADQKGQRTFGYYPLTPSQSGLYADPRIDDQLTIAYLRNRGLDEEEAAKVCEGIHAPEYATVEVVTISDILADNHVDRVALLKIDVERAELDVLRGIADDDWHRIRSVVVEVQDIDGRLDICSNLLAEAGFTVSHQQEPWLADTNLHTLMATRL
ncbi:amino acid adenylation domain-containing protein [Streptomyces sp. NPDC005708]|uniref:amino acid adenylation domain-containing protein n=1 Tax=Streptomyces sp. NPDC005708 TaxID=3154564 RepID=UPI0033D60A13